MATREVKEALMNYIEKERLESRVNRNDLDGIIENILNDIDWRLEEYQEATERN